MRQRHHTIQSLGRHATTRRRCGALLLVLVATAAVLPARFQPARAQGPITVIADDVTVTESNDGGVIAEVVVSLSEPAVEEVSVRLTTRDGSARAGDDYVPLRETVTFQPDEVSQVVPIKILTDGVPEADETFTVDLSKANGVTIADPLALVTIVDDDLGLTIIDADTSKDATPPLVRFEIQLSAASPEPVSVDFATEDASATAGIDYLPVAGTLTFAPGQLTKYVDVLVLPSPNLTLIPEVFYLRLVRSFGARIQDAMAVGTINEGPQSVSSKDTDAVESVGVASWEIELLNPFTEPVEVTFRTEDGSAIAGRDYEATSGRLVIPPGHLNAIVDVPIKNDQIPEGDEVYYLDVRTVEGGLILDSRGIGTIFDDDRTVGLTEIEVTEGDTGTTDAVFVAALSAASDSPVTVSYATANGTAIAGSDYEARSGSLTFAPGQIEAHIPVPVIGDRLEESPDAPETFKLSLSDPKGASLSGASVNCSIYDDDRNLGLEAVEVTEDDAGEEVAEFTVTPSSPGTSGMTVRYATVDGSAKAGQDYKATTGTLNFAIGEESLTVEVPILGDDLREGNETFKLALSDPVNVRLGEKATAEATIIDDDLGYWLAADDGGVLGYGDVVDAGGRETTDEDAPPIVGIASSGGGHGYWLAAADGSVTALGDAKPFDHSGGSLGKGPAVGIAALRNGNGYWLVGPGGAVACYGAAPCLGDTAALPLNHPVVGIAATPTGDGYWLVAADGGVFSFGDATFFGSTGALVLNKPVVGIAPTPHGAGYWLVATDGGVFSFGDAKFFGSTGDMELNGPVVALLATPGGKGYWLFGGDGGVFSFGDAPFQGSAGDEKDLSVVGAAAPPATAPAAP